MEKYLEYLRKVMIESDKFTLDNLKYTNHIIKVILNDNNHSLMRYLHNNIQTHLNKDVMNFEIFSRNERIKTLLNV